MLIGFSFLVFSVVSVDLTLDPISSVVSVDFPLDPMSGVRLSKPGKCIKRVKYLPPGRTVHSTRGLHGPKTGLYATQQPHVQRRSTTNMFSVCSYVVNFSSFISVAVVYFIYFISRWETLCRQESMWARTTLFFFSFFGLASLTKAQ